MTNRSKLLLVSWIIGALYLAYIMIYFFSKAVGGSNWTESLGVGIAAMLVAPHMFFVFLAVLFNIIGWAASKRWAALTGAILYCVAAIMFFLYSFFVVPSIVLSFVSFAKMKNQAEAISAPTPTAEFATSATWFDRLIPAGSACEKALPFVCAAASFAVTLTVLIALFA